MDNKNQAVWEDSTSYSRDDKNRVQTGWSITIGDIRISITRGHVYYKGEFVMHCNALGFDTYVLNIPGDKIDEAKQKSIRLCTSRAARYLQLLNELNK